MLIRWLTTCDAFSEQWLCQETGKKNPGNPFTLGVLLGKCRVLTQGVPKQEAWMLPSSETHSWPGLVAQEITQYRRLTFTVMFETALNPCRPAMAHLTWTLRLN
jgi:hypothetical protein